MNDPTADLLTALLAATPERKAAALRLLKGEVPETVVPPVAGPLFLNMTKSAELAGISRTSLWRLVTSGRLQRVELHQGQGKRI